MVGKQNMRYSSTNHDKTRVNRHLIPSLRNTAIAVDKLR